MSFSPIFIPSLTTTSTSSSAASQTAIPEKLPGSQDIVPVKTNYKQTVILSVVFAGWAILALVFFILVVRRRGKLLHDRHADLEHQQMQTIGMQPRFSHLTLGIEYRPSRRSRQLPVLNSNELSLVPVMTIGEYTNSTNNNHTSEQAVEKNDKLTIDEEQPMCIICLDGYKVEDRVRVLGCSHAFHSSCVDKWLLKRSCKCPLCNFDTRCTLGLPKRPSEAKLTE
ncbi:hypothetical protein GGI25_000581 [Coemansia spiralis]|uniref:RING-type E3 ubiquitin transferase n=2 Tax=Coemansia TaxID=4863 RepID=A0A9W8GCA4_9FUNG|nr:hypothetical protein BX070DRAFT_236691 [Coemansia spiralis]KAJ1996042.1 hypothetical protein EDC05_000410 [Coemansia umbellata]KAJ2625483.1 hypothetical protein GGI26_000623 [Coemansia sp. RSA 1358]KAJ2680608.1 hypothetical protein GGI25_000581 [Coemansia spiralis]